MWTGKYTLRSKRGPVTIPRLYHISPKRWRWCKTVGFKWRSSSFHSLESELQRTVYSCIDYCLKESIGNPVEILKCAQRFLLCVRPLDVTDPSAPLDGETNFILVKRQNVFQSAKEEFQSVSVDTNPGVTLEMGKMLVGKVYGEGAVDA